MASLLTSFSSTAGSRRTHAADDALAGAHWLFGRHRLEVNSHQLVRDDHRIRLDERGFAVLTCLLRNAGRVVPRATLVAESWPGVEHVTDSAVSKTMRRLRIALGNDGGRTLVTVYGVGYRLATPAVLVPAGTTLTAGMADAAHTAGVAPASRTEPAPGAGPAAAKASGHWPRAWHHRVLVLVVVLLSALLAGWLLLGSVAR